MFAQSEAATLFGEGKTEQGIAVYRNAIANARAQKNSFTSNLWINFADQLARLGRADEARQELIALWSWAGEENLPFAQGRAAEGLARLEHQLGNEAASRKWREDAIAAYDAGGFDEKAIDARIAFAMSTKAKDADTASRLLTAARKLAKKNPRFSKKLFTIDLASADNALGQNKPREAEVYLDRAAEELGFETAENGTRWADIHIRRARLAVARKDEERADDAALKAVLAVDRSRLPPVNKSGALTSVAMHLWALGYRDASRDVAARAADIAEASTFTDGISEKEINNSPLAVQAADYRIKYAKFEDLLGNHDAAAKAYARALEFVPENKGLDSGRSFIGLQTSTPYRLEALLGLARTHIEMGDLDKATPLAEQALELASRKGNEAGRLEAEVTLAEATRNSEAFKNAIDRQLKARKKQSPENAIKTLLRFARFHAASDDIREKEAGLTVALVAIISVRTDTQRLEAAKLILDTADEIVAKGPPEYKLKADGLAETREFYESRKNEILKRATRLSPVPWS